MVELATAFVLLVAGGCARATLQPWWRRFVHWWHTDGKEPPEFKFMDRLAKLIMAEPYRPPLPPQGYRDVDIAATKTEAEAKEALDRLTKLMEKQYTGTKNARKPPIHYVY